MDDEEFFKPAQVSTLGCSVCARMQVRSVDYIAVLDAWQMHWPEGPAGWFATLNYNKAPRPYDELDPPILHTAAHAQEGGGGGGGGGGAVRNQRLDKSTIALQLGSVSAL